MKDPLFWPIVDILQPIAGQHTDPISWGPLAEYIAAGSFPHKDLEGDYVTKVQEGIRVLHDWCKNDMHEPIQLKWRYNTELLNSEKWNDHLFLLYLDMPSFRYVAKRLGYKGEREKGIWQRFLTHYCQENKCDNFSPNYFEKAALVASNLVFTEQTRSINRILAAGQRKDDCCMQTLLCMEDLEVESSHRQSRLIEETLSDLVSFFTMAQKTEKEMQRLSFAFQRRFLGSDLKIVDVCERMPWPMFKSCARTNLFAMILKKYGNDEYTFFNRILAPILQRIARKRGGMVSMFDELIAECEFFQNADNLSRITIKLPCDLKYSLLAVLLDSLDQKKHKKFFAQDHMCGHYLDMLSAGGRYVDKWFAAYSYPKELTDFFVLRQREVYYRPLSPQRAKWLKEKVKPEIIADEKNLALRAQEKEYTYFAEALPHLDFIHVLKIYMNSPGEECVDKYEFSRKAFEAAVVYLLQSNKEQDKQQVMHSLKVIRRYFSTDWVNILFGAISKHEGDHRWNYMLGRWLLATLPPIHSLENHYQQLESWYQQACQHHDVVMMCLCRGYQLIMICQNVFNVWAQQIRAATDRLVSLGSQLVQFGRSTKSYVCERLFPSVYSRSSGSEQSSSLISSQEEPDEAAEGRRSNRGYEEVPTSRV